MSDLELKFKKAAHFVAKSPPRAGATNDEKLKVYALFKQATKGDVEGSQPWAVQMEARAKWDAWNALKGKSKEDAMQEYIAIVEAGDPDWENSEIAKSFSGLATACLHAGQPIDQHSGAVITPMVLSSTFAQKAPGELYPGGFEYSRSGNPTRQAFEKCVAACEGAEYGLAFASGSMVLTTICAMFGPGDEIVTVDDVYGGTNRFFRQVATPSSGLKIHMVDATNVETLLAKVHKGTKMVWLETPTNPTLKICDLKAICDAVHAINKDIIVVCDNTFASPFFQRPLLFGVDLVMHSVSKYINGHTDVIGGVIATNNKAIYSKLQFLQNAMGGIPAPFDCGMALRGLKTLCVRMPKHEENAMQVAKFLQSHPKVDRVAYPGLESHPQHKIAKKQMTGYGGMITFWLKGNLENARQFCSAIALSSGPFVFAESLGGVDSMFEHPGIMTHAAVPIADRHKLGISDSLIRLSVGLEDMDDILNHLKIGFDAVNLNLKRSAPQ